MRTYADTDGRHVFVRTRHEVRERRARRRAGYRGHRRYERDAPGDLVHVDIKKLGRIPDGGGWKVLGYAEGHKNQRTENLTRRAGYGFIHSALDDHSRLAYSEILGDEKKGTAVAFWLRARDWFAEHGVEVREVLTDNGSCHRQFRLP